LIFSGLKTLNQNICTTQKHAELIAENGSDVKRIFAKTMNRVVCYNTGYPINLLKLSEKSPFNIKYEPDVFPACSIELDEKWVSSVVPLHHTFFSNIFFLFYVK
jgi:TATA-box binding protein (TBP) (component of TFIID and TFIIIB)